MSPSMSPSILFVCWGNICRSPMAERIAMSWAERAGIEATFRSAGVSDEERGNPIDYRAVKVLQESGYSTKGHRAHKVTAAEILNADLVIGLEQLHNDLMLRLAPHARNLALLTDFDPRAPKGSGIPDPWYGGPEGFYETRDAIEAAVPGLLTKVRELAARW